MNHLFTEPKCKHNKNWNCCEECSKSKLSTKFNFMNKNIEEAKKCKIHGIHPYNDECPVCDYEINSVISEEITEGYYLKTPEEITEPKEPVDLGENKQCVNCGNRICTCKNRNWDGSIKQEPNKKECEHKDKIYIKNCFNYCPTCKTILSRYKQEPTSEDRQHQETEDWEEILYKNFKCTTDCNRGYFRSRSNKTKWKCEQCTKAIAEIKSIFQFTIDKEIQKERNRIIEWAERKIEIHKQIIADHDIYPKDWHEGNIEALEKTIEINKS